MADDEEMLLSLCAASVVAVIMKRRKKRQKNSENVDSRMAKKQDLFRGILTLLAELRNQSGAA